MARNTKDKTDMPAARIIEQVDTPENRSVSNRNWSRETPAAKNPRRLQPYGQSPQGREIYPDFDHDDHLGYYGHRNHNNESRGDVNVSVNTAAYRPWKEEVGLSFLRTIGNFFGWPFRLIGKFVEGIMGMFVRVLGMILLFVIAPTVIFAGISYYQENKDRPTTEMAHDIGAEGVGLVGSVLGGIWDGIFGDDEPTKEDAPAKG